MAALIADLATAFHGTYLNSELLHGVALATAGWAALFVATLKVSPRSLNQANRIYFASCIIGTAHAIFTGSVAVWLLMSGKLPAWHGFEHPSAEWEGAIIISFGYFAYDAILIILSPTMPGRFEMLLHHFLGLTMHFSPVCIYQKFAAISCMGYLCELSTPFVNARWILKEVGGGSGTLAYALNGIAMIVAFATFRVIAGLAYLYQIFVLVPRLGPAFSELGVLGNFIQPGAILFYALNLYWMYKILAGAIKLFFPKRDMDGAAKAAAREASSNAARSVKADAYPVNKAD